MCAVHTVIILSSFIHPFSSSHQSLYTGWFMSLTNLLFQPTHIHTRTHNNRTQLADRRSPAAHTVWLLVCLLHSLTMEGHIVLYSIVMLIVISTRTNPNLILYSKLFFFVMKNKLFRVCINHFPVGDLLHFTSKRITMSKTGTCTQCAILICLE